MCICYLIILALLGWRTLDGMMEVKEVMFGFLFGTFRHTPHYYLYIYIFDLFYEVILNVRLSVGDVYMCGKDSSFPGDL